MKELTNDELLDLYNRYHEIKNSLLVFRGVGSCVGSCPDVVTLAPLGAAPPLQNVDTTTNEKYESYPIWKFDEYDDKSTEYRFLRSCFKRKYNANKRVKKILEKYEFNYFVTLTLKDEFLNYDIKTLITYARRYIKGISLNFLGNTDYGKVNNRLHFHFIIGRNEELNFNNTIWKYGYYNFKRVYKSNDYLKIANYITKLTLHALKNGSKTRLIYSR
ncbi:MAG: hypothetical protein MJ191_05715 [Clostridium sp.]|nr:hypothetical protein [Clostridium sp.]